MRAPLRWSEWSCVTKAAESLFGAEPTAASASSSAFSEKPHSTSTWQPSDSTRYALPLDPLARDQTCTGWALRARFCGAHRGTTPSGFYEDEGTGGDGSPPDACITVAALFGASAAGY